MPSAITDDQVAHATEVEKGANDAAPTFEADIKSLVRERDRADSGTPR
jgi:hypothetical protein